MFGMGGIGETIKKLLALSVLATVAVAAHATSIAPIYDCMTGVSSYTTSTSNPGNTFGDGASSIVPRPGPNHITSIDFGMFVVGAQTFAANELVAQINIYSSYDGSGANPVMGSLVGSAFYGLGAFSTTGNAAFSITGGALSTPIDLPTNMSTMGWTMTFLRNNVKTGTVRAAFTTTVLPTVGTSPIGFYRDANDDGIITADENRVFGTGTDPSDNMVIRFNAVPEPASMAVLGLGVAALLRRRKKA